MTLLSQVARLAQTANVPDTQQISLAIGYLAQSIALQANTLAFRDGFLVVTFVFLLALFPTYLLHRAQRQAGHQAT
jgi:hypothetical protein